MNPARRVLLIILDGFGVAPSASDNAVTEADMKTFNELWNAHPHAVLNASGNAVGLPEGFQGNSEVGHITLGAGRVVLQSLEEINATIRENTFFEHKILVDAIDRIKKENTTGGKRALHLVGMISDEGVHSHIDHLFALLELAKREEAFPLYIHAILDGRDVPERSAHLYLDKLNQKIEQLGLDQPIHLDGPPKVSVASLIGRYYAMDRDHNWDRTQAAYDLMVNGTGVHERDAKEALKNAYENGAKSDYYVPAIQLTPPGDNGRIKDGDSVICFNYRTDRTRQWTEAMVDKKFDRFPVSHGDIHFVAFGSYTDHAPVAFPAPIIEQNLGHVLAENGKTQLRIAETEKYAHVTYFLNSQVEEPEAGETRVLIDSPKCASYETQPEMSAIPLTDRLMQEIQSERYDFIAVNYANADLVGHSGNLEATIKCCRVLDDCLAQIVPVAVQNGYTVILTSDHGNAEDMRYTNGEPCPSHTTNRVPVVIVATEPLNDSLKSNGGLQDIAPTVLSLMGLPIPSLMTGTPLTPTQ